MEKDISPSYYKGKGLELCDVLIAFKCDFLIGNIIKYAIRYSEKGEKGGVKVGVYLRGIVITTTGSREGQKHG